MDEKEFYRELRGLVIPIAMSQLMTSLVSLSDTVMLGFVSQDALSAVSLAGQVQFVFQLFLFSITAGVCVLAAQYWGKGDRDTVEKILGIAMRLSLPISLLFSLAAFCFPETLMTCFASDSVLIANGAIYLKAVAPSYLFLGTSQVYLCILKNCGRATIGSVISSSSVVINIIFNFLLIFGIGFFPRLEIQGAALATAFAKLVELIWTYAIMLQKGSLKLRLCHILKADKLLWHDYVKYSTPLLINNLAWGVGFTMYSVIMGHLGSDATSANSIANIVKNLAICVGEGVANASGVMVGIQLGKGELEKARIYGKKLCQISFAFGIVSAVIILCVIPFTYLFSNISDTAQDYLRIMLGISSYYVIGKAMNMTIIGGIFPAGGDTRFGVICDTVTMWVVTVPIGLLAAFLFKLPVLAVYALINTDEIIKLPAVFWNYKKYHWVKRIVRED